MKPIDINRAAMFLAMAVGIVTAALSGLCAWLASGSSSAVMVAWLCFVSLTLIAFSGVSFMATAGLAREVLNDQIKEKGKE